MNASLLDLSVRSDMMLYEMHLGDLDGNDQIS